MRVAGSIFSMSLTRSSGRSAMETNMPPVINPAWVELVIGTISSFPCFSFAFRYGMGLGKKGGGKED